MIVIGPFLTTKCNGKKFQATIKQLKNLLYDK